MALGLLAMLFWGYQMWWLRRPTRASATSRFSAPVGRGSLRQLSQPVLFLIVVLTAAIGWVIPILGLSLLAFLVADQIWIRIRQRQPRQQPPAATEADDQVLVRQE